jgi:hypothetical protein
MLEGENMKYWILEILKIFAIPAILILTIIIILPRFIDINFQETSNVVLGVMLGVVLGFSADLIKRGLDDFTKTQKLKKVSLRLLGEDAEGIYRLHWLWEWARKYKSSQISEDIKKQIPPMINLNYWDILKHDKEFLLLGTDNPFNEIFKSMWNFESINSQIKLAEEGDKDAANLAVKLFEITVKEKYHKKLLLLFKTGQEIKELDKKYSDRKT